MQASSADTVREFGTLVAAVRRNKGIDAHLLPSDSTWHELFPALTRRATSVQECLIRQGDGNRNLYFLESGLLRVYRAGPDVRLQLAVLGAGSVVGEGTFFAPIVRNASVEALEPTALWELTPAGFDAFAARNPVAGLQLCRYLGAVLATRMLSVTGRLSIT